jgi:hypothetical protein
MAFFCLPTFRESNRVQHFVNHYEQATSPTAQEEKEQQENIPLEMGAPEKGFPIGLRQPI